MLKIKNYILLCILALVSVSAVAQRSTVRITVEPSEIYIGEHAVINLEVIAPKGRDIQFPVYADTLMRGIEVLKMFDADTTMTEVMTLRKKYLITSFDSTLYHIPYMQVIDGADTIRSNDLGFKVTTPPMSEGVLQYLEQMNTGQVDSIDFVQLELADIKDIQDPEFVWSDYLLYFLIPIIVALIVILGVIAYYLYQKKRKKGYFFRPKVIEPAHVVALRELDKLKDKKLSQAGLEKEYYTELTDILRVYINHRYPSINATEMITEDILKAVQKVTETKSPEEGLQQILELADLVKFAKYTPLQNENDLSMANAFIFVNQTKKIEVEPTDKDGKPLPATAKGKVKPATKKLEKKAKPNEGNEESTNS